MRCCHFNERTCFKRTISCGVSILSLDTDSKRLFYILVLNHVVGMFRILHTFNTFTLQDTISLWGQTDHRSVNESGSAKPVLCPCQAAGRVDDLEPTDNNDNKHAVIFTPVPPALQLDLQRKHSAARLDLMSSCWCLSVISNSPLALRTALHKAIKRRSMTHSVVCSVILLSQWLPPFSLQSRLNPHSSVRGSLQS